MQKYPHKDFSLCRQVKDQLNAILRSYRSFFKKSLSPQTSERKVLVHLSCSDSQTWMGSMFKSSFPNCKFIWIHFFDTEFINRSILLLYTVCCAYILSQHTSSLQILNSRLLRHTNLKKREKTSVHKMCNHSDIYPAWLTGRRRGEAWRRTWKVMVWRILVTFKDKIRGPGVVVFFQNTVLG